MTPIKIRHIGFFWRDQSIELVEINGTVYALNGWNGEEYTDGWVCYPPYFTEASEDSYTLRPVYRFEDEVIDLGSIEEGSEKWEYAVQIVDYKVSKN